MFYYFLRARSGLRNRKKIGKQAFWNIKNNEIAAFNIRNTFFRNLNNFLHFTFANFPKKVRREKKLVELLVISV